MAAVIVAFVALGVLKPWGTPKSTPAASHPIAQQLTTVGPTQLPAGPPPPGSVADQQPKTAPIAYLSEPVSLSLTEVRAALAGASATGSTARVLPGAGQTVIRTDLLRQTPTTQALGATCQSAPVVPVGHAAFALTVPRATATVSVSRLFATGSPLPVSTEVTLDSNNSLALVSLRQASWPLGHYTVVITSRRGTVSYLPFCVSANVPPTADAPAARFELWDPAQP